METTTLVSPEDENLHPPGSDPLWSESFYLNFSHSDGVLGGFVRVALHPYKRESEGLLGLYLPEGGVGIVLLKDALEQPDANKVRAGNLSYERVDPLKRWRIRYQGDVHVYNDPEGSKRTVDLDLEAIGLHVPFYYPKYRRVTSGPRHRQRPASFAGRLKRTLRRPREILSALTMRSGRHYEQSMRVRGSVSIGTQRIEIDGSGHRDHSWGVRDWMPSHRWRWLTGQLGDFAFNAMYLTIAGTHVTNGYVWHRDHCSPLEELSLENSFDDTGLGGRDLCLALTAGGERFVITGNVSLNVPLPIIGPGFSTMYHIGRTRYRWGNRVGHGVAEFLERLDP
jgi:hypothetical protein